MNSVADWRSNLVLDRFPSDNDLTRTLIGRIAGMLPWSPKNRFFGSKKLQTKKKADDGSEFERAFLGAVQFALDSGFTNILELKPVQEALVHFIKRKDVFAVLPTGCGKSLIFQIVLRVCTYLHDRGFNYPNAVVLVVVCPLTALIDAHIKELKIMQTLQTQKLLPLDSFYSRSTCRPVKLRKQTDPAKNRFGELSCFKIAWK